jgi:hypothetical protein
MRMTGTRRILSEKQCVEVINLYLSGETARKIGEKYSVNEATIRLVLRRNNIERRVSRPVYFKDDNFFREIDTKEKAWMLGLIYADGSVSDRQGLRLGFARKDLELIHKIKRMVKSDAPIYVHPNGSVHLKIMGKDFMRNLSNWCVIGKKVHRLIYPNFLRQDLHSHFIRGFFDGDGWVSHMSGMCSMSKLFLESVLNILHNQDICRGACVNVSGGIYKIYINGRNNAKKFYDFIYMNADDSMLLSRKKKKFERIWGWEY